MDLNAHLRVQPLVVLCEAGESSLHPLIIQVMSDADYLLLRQERIAGREGYAPHVQYTDQVDADDTNRCQAASEKASATA